MPRYPQFKWDDVRGRHLGYKKTSLPRSSHCLLKLGFTGLLRKSIPTSFGPFTETRKNVVTHSSPTKQKNPYAELEMSWFHEKNSVSSHIQWDFIALELEDKFLRRFCFEEAKSPYSVSSHLPPIYSKICEELTKAGIKNLISLREAECTALALCGFTSKQIGIFLEISFRTVEKNLEHAYEKLGCYGRSHCMETMYVKGVLIHWQDFGRDLILGKEELFRICQDQK